MSDPILLRRRIRLVLSALPANRRASEPLLFDKLLPDFPELKLDEMRHALSWNQSHGYVEYRYVDDQERNEWFLTETGRHKEGLS